MAKKIKVFDSEKMSDTQIKSRNAARIRQEKFVLDNADLTAKMSSISPSERRKLMQREMIDVQREYKRSIWGPIGSDVVNPYDITPANQRSKLNREKLMSMTHDVYRNDLLERLLKISDRSLMDNSTLKFQEQILVQISNMSVDIKQIAEYLKPKEEVQKQNEEIKELAMEVSGLAKSIAAGDIGGTLKELKTNIFNKLDTSGYGDLMKTMYDSIKDSIKSGEFGGMVKSMMQEAMINQLPGNMKRTVEQFRSDPVKLIQMTINQMALDQNGALRSVFGGSYRGMKPNLDYQTKTIDMSAKANFDNKFYTSVTKIIPEQLYRIVAALEKREIRMFDFDETQEYRSASSFAAEEFRAMKSKSLTAITDKTMISFSNVVSDAVGRNSNLKNHVYMDGNNVAKDAQTRMVKFKNDSNIRSIWSAMLRSEGTLWDYMRGDIFALIKRFNLDRDKTPTERAKLYDGLKFIQDTIRNIPPEDFEDLATDFEEGKIALDKRERSKALSLLNKEEMQAYEALYMNPELNAKEIGTATKMMSGGVNVRGMGTRGGSSGVIRGSAGISSTEEAINYIKRHRNNRNLSDKEKDDVAKLIENLATGKHDSAAFIYSKEYQDLHNGVNRMKTPEGQYKSTVEMMRGYGLISDRQSESWGAKNSEDELGSTVRRKFDANITKINRATEIYRTLSMAGMTAEGRAKTVGNTVAYWKSRGYIGDISALFPVLKDDGNIDVTKLAKYNMEFMTEDYIKDAEKLGTERTKETLGTGGAITSQISKTLSGIFGDPRIANKAGMVVGGAAGLGIAKLLKDNGIIKSPSFGYILGAVGAGLMTMERSRRYMQNIFGPEGDIRGNDGKGFTNKEIFMTKLLTKYLPAVGAGAKSGKFVLKALSSLGPAGTLIGIPAALLTSLTVGMATPHLMSAFQNTLFKKRDKDDKSIFGKIGNLLKEVPFVQKYFSIYDSTTDSEMRLKTLDRIKSDLNYQLMNLESQGQGQGTAAQKLRNNIQKVDALISDVTKIVSSGADESTKIATIDAQINQFLNATGKDIFSNELYTETLSASIEERDRKNEMGSAANYSYHDPVKEKRKKHLSAKEAFDLEQASASGQNFNLSNAQDRILARSGRYGKKAAILATVRDVLDDPDNDIESELTNDAVSYLTSKNDYGKSVLEVLKENEDPIFGKLKSNEVTAFKTMMLVNKDKTPQQQRAAYLEWKNSLSPESQEALNESLRTRREADGYFSNMYEIAEEYIRRTSPGIKDIEVQSEAGSLIRRMFESRPLHEKLTSQVGNTFNSTIASLVSRLSGGTIETSDLNEHQEATEYMSIMENINSGKGGRGSSDPVTSLIKMSNLSNKKFKTGESLSAAGCSIVAFANALTYMGITPPDIDTMIDIANNHLTKDGGVSSNFFLELCNKLGININIFNNQDNKLSADAIKQVAPNSSKGLIILVKNVHSTGNHYITVKSVNGDKAIIDDPESSGVNDTSLSDISVRAIELISLAQTSASKTTLKETAVSRANKTNKTGNSASIASGIVGAIPIVGNLFKLYNSVKGNGLKGSGKLSDFATVDKFGSGSIPNSNDNSTNIVSALIDLFKNNIMNVRIVDDYTLGIKMGDGRAAQALNQMQATATGGNSMLANSISKVKRYFQNRDVKVELNKQDAVQNAILNGGLVSGGSTGYGGKGTGTPDNNNQSGGGLVNSLFKIGKNAKGLIGAALGGVAIPAALGAAGAYAMYKGVKHGGKRMVSGIKSIMPWTEQAQDTETKYDEEGNVIEKANYYDPSGGISMVKEGAAIAGLGGLAGKKLASLGSKLGSKYLGKAAEAAARGGAKGVAAKALLSTGNIVKMLNNTFAKMGNWIYTKVIGLPFFSNSTKGTIGKMVQKAVGMAMTFLNKIAPKIAGKLSQIGAKAAAKNIPVVGLIIVAIQFVAALYTGYKKAEKILNVPTEQIDTTDRIKVALIKALYDCLPDLLICFIPPPFNLIGTVGMMFVREFFTLNDLLNIFFPAEKKFKTDTQAYADEKIKEAEKADDKAYERGGTQNEAKHDRTGLGTEGLAIANTASKDTEFSRDYKDFQEGDMESFKKTALANKDNWTMWDKVKHAWDGSTPNKLDINKMIIKDNRTTGKYAYGKSLTEGALADIDLSKYPMLESTVNMIAAHEGFRSKVYKDTKGKDTIGYGFNLVDGTFSPDQVARWRQNGITKDEADRILVTEVVRMYDKMDSDTDWFKSLDPSRKSAVVDMAFNMGPGWHKKFPKTVDAIKKGDWETAGMEILSSNYASQVGNRAKEIAGIIVTGAVSGKYMTENDLRAMKAAYSTYAGVSNPYGMMNYNTAVSMENKTIAGMPILNNPEGGGVFNVSKEAYKYSEDDKELYELWKANADKFYHPRGDNMTVITSAFGPRNVPNGSRNHKGVDFRGSLGDPVFSAHGGEIVEIDPSYGTVTLQDGDLATRYMHLDSWKYNVGDVVGKGEQIGTVGGRGAGQRSKYAPHLHFEMLNQGRAMDPFIALGLPKEAFKDTEENNNYIKNAKWLNPEEYKGIIDSQKANSTVTVDPKTDISKTNSNTEAAGPPNNYYNFDNSTHSSGGTSNNVSTFTAESQKTQQVLTAILSTLQTMSTALEGLLSVNNKMLNNSVGDTVEMLRSSIIQRG